jgi:hypothetical protein
MRKLRDTKGQMRVIETILAASIILGAVSFVGVLAVRPTSLTYEMTDLEKMGYSALHDLDQQNLLASFVYEGEWSNLRTALKITLPVDVYFNLTVYDLKGSKLNEKNQVVYGDSATFSNAKNIASITYCLSGIATQAGTGYTAEYDPRIVVLLVTRG